MNGIERCTLMSTTAEVAVHEVEGRSMNPGSRSTCSAGPFARAAPSSQRP